MSLWKEIVAVVAVFLVDALEHVYGVGQLLAGVLFYGKCGRLDSTFLLFVDRILHYPECGMYHHSHSLEHLSNAGFCQPA